jgi:hypothetical protein
MSDIRRKVDAIVHLARGPFSGNIQLVCHVGKWFQSKWGPEDCDKTIDPEIFIANNDLLYTFNQEKKTCIDCKVMRKEKSNG